MAVDVIYPLRHLRELSTELEAALTVCLAEPTPKAVHRLRTGTRRVEAIVRLLRDVPGLPGHKRAGQALGQSLRKLRRAAGQVRDFDVQGKRLESLAEAGLSAGDAHALRDHLQGQRAKAAAKLSRLLEDKQAGTADAVEALLKKLKPAEGKPTPREISLRCAETILLAEGLLARSLTAALTEEELHTVRKGAKAARYLAELPPETPAARTAAQRFESLQDAGGAWHDALDLQRAAKRFLGKRHPLTAALGGERDRNLRLYREALRAEARRSRPDEDGGRSGKAEHGILVATPV